MDAHDPLFEEIDRLISLSRLKELTFIMETRHDQRIAYIAEALGRLEIGEYLLGTGPSTAGIVPLSADETILGRPATAAERPLDICVDHAATDTLYFSPREVSRVHAKIIRRRASRGATHWLYDLGSTCGTYVNGLRVNPRGEGRRLVHGNVLSLGPSQTSTYVYYRVRTAPIGTAWAGHRQRLSWMWIPER